MCTILVTSDNSKRDNFSYDLAEATFASYESLFFIYEYTI